MEQCLALGVNLGWCQQGAAFGGRERHMLTADLERIRNHAGAAGFTGFTNFADTAVTKLDRMQPLANIIPEVNGLIALCQGSAAGIALQTLDLGLRLGLAGQGELAGTRPQAADDLNAAQLHAHAAGYRGFEGMLAAALARVRAGQGLNAANEINDLIEFLQKQH
jgi:hypothetical protein